jgi:hypothetical protein
LIGQQGHILAMFDTNNIFLADPKNGIWPNNIYALQGDGSWANKDDFDDLISVLETDFLTAESDRFELWWTLTCQADKALECSVRELAGKVNPHLKDFVDSLDIPNDNGNTINEIWVDFAEETAATEIAIRLTPIAIDIDIKPENNHNPINPRAHGVVWVALLSDTETSMDALQVDIPTVRFGAAGAMANLHKVKDVNRDGLADLLLRFQVSETYIDCENTEATLRGKTYDGQSILGIGFINTVGCSFHSGEMNQVTDSDLDSEVTAEVNDTKTSREVTSEVNVANIDSEVNTDATTLVQGSGGIFQPILLPLLLLFGYIRRNVNT